MLILALIAAIALPPKPDRYVTDHAGVVRNADALNEQLAKFERDTSDQILVYVDKHLPPDTTIEQMGSEAMKQWGVGQKGKDNGAILFVFTDDRKMRIEVGYGLEGALTDAKSKRIIETVIKPHFKAGDYSTGVSEGTSAIIAAIRGEPYQGTGQTVAERPRAPEVKVPVWSCLLIMAFVFGVFVMILLIVRKAVKSAGGRTITGMSSSGSTSSWSTSDSSSSFSSSSSDSSSFSGGGGSGGGGGASGSW